MLRRPWGRLTNLLLPLLAFGLALGPPAMVLAEIQAGPAVEQHHGHRGKDHSPSGTDCCQRCEACYTSQPVAPQPAVIPVAAPTLRLPVAPADAASIRLLHLSGGVRIGTLLLSTGVRNLLDHAYPELRAGGFVAPGRPRSVYGTVRYVF